MSASPAEEARVAGWTRAHWLTWLQSPQTRLTAMERANVASLLEAALPASPAGWRSMADAAKDGTPVMLKVRDSLPGRPDMDGFLGVRFVGRNYGALLPRAGRDEEPYDPGWNFAAPVGVGGFPDEWLEGWRPIE